MYPTLPVVFVIALFLIVCSTAGCSSGDSSARMAAGPPLAEVAGEWVLTHLGTDLATDLFPDPSRRPTLTLAPDGGVSGFAGINRFTGTFDPAAYNDGELNFDRLAATRMAGDPSTMALETRFMEAMNRIDGMRLEGGDLVLTSGDVAELRFRRTE